MRAVWWLEVGPPSVLVPGDAPDPIAGPDQVLIRVEAAGITFIETQTRAGRAPRATITPPAILGNGVGGTTQDGRRVVSSLGGAGGYAELAVAAAADVLDVPDGVSITEATALLADGRTALGLHQLVAPQPGETVLVEAAAGGVGSLLVQLAVAAGATTVNLPDTVGYSLPDEHELFLRRIRNLCPALAHVTLSVHCHNDLGLAVANTLSGIRAGATQVECTVNGIGERAGNAALEEVAMALRVRAAELQAETGVVVGEIGAASDLVSRLTGYAVQRNKAIVGANAFAHEAGIHQDGMLKDVSTYQIMDPEELGLTMTLPLGKHSGRHAFARACEHAGIDLTAEELRSAFTRFKRLADQRKAVTLYDVFEEVPVR